MRKNIRTFRGNMGLYRGKPKYNSDGKISNPDLVKYYDFVYGSLVISGERYFICLDVDIILPNNIFVNNARASMVEVLPETVGEFAGITDKNKIEIFEGDIVYCYGGNCYFGIWEYDEIIAVKTIFDYEQMFYLKQADYIEILGNIYDNPELIKKEV